MEKTYSVNVHFNGEYELNQLGIKVRDVNTSDIKYSSISLGDVTFFFDNIEQIDEVINELKRLSKKAKKGDC